MPRYRVSGSVVGSKYLGEFEADTPEEAVEKAIKKNGYVSLCHECAPECGDAMVEQGFAELIEDDED